MEELTSLSKMMIKHHAYIEELFQVFKEQIGKEYAVMRETFNTFEGILKKHFAVEEENLFKFADLNDVNVAKLVHNLITDHFSMRGMVDTIKKSMERGEKLDFSVLDTLLVKHRMIEDSVLYPRMENELDAWRKDEVIEIICALEKSASLQGFR